MAREKERRGREGREKKEIKEFRKRLLINYYYQTSLLVRVMAQS